MTDDDIQQLIERLTRKMKATGLDWALDEYFATIRAGKIQTKDAKYEYWSEDKQAFRPASKAKKVTVTVPFSPREQALLLLDTIENSSVVPHDVATAVDANLKELIPDTQFTHIEFKPDLESLAMTTGSDESLPDTIKGFFVDFGEEANKASEAAKLRGACRKLREAI